MSSLPKFYGFFRVMERYHISSDCPVLKHIVKSKSHMELREYPSESGAIAAGHTRRCKQCSGNKVFIVRGNHERVRVSKEQYSTLTIVADIFKKSGPMTLQAISIRRNRSIVSTYFIIRTLRSLKLIEQKMKMGCQRASGRSIAPTRLGIEIVKSEELP
jgi:hypothetical protein